MLRFALLFLALASSSRAASVVGDYGVSTTGYVQTAGVSATNISATRISGDGSGLTNLPIGASGDHITSGTTQAIAYNNANLSFVTSGVERMVIDATGLIGVGQQPQPGYAVFISSTAGIIGSRTGTASGYVGTLSGGYNIGSLSNHPLVTNALRSLSTDFAAYKERQSHMIEVK